MGFSSQCEPTNRQTGATALRRSQNGKAPSGACVWEKPVREPGVSLRARPGHGACFLKGNTKHGGKQMAEYLSAIFRSYRDARDARRSLDESGLCASGAFFLFALSPSTRSVRAMCPAHELDYAEYTGHGEQFAIAAVNRFTEPHMDYFFASMVDDGRTGHTLLVAADPRPAMLVQICATLKDCGAFAIRTPGSRWRLCNSR
jgi:hypothetical protein